MNDYDDTFFFSFQKLNNNNDKLKAALRDYEDWQGKQKLSKDMSLDFYDRSKIPNRHGKDLSP